METVADAAAKLLAEEQQDQCAFHRGTPIDGPTTPPCEPVPSDAVHPKIIARIRMSADQTDRRDGEMPIGFGGPNHKHAAANARRSAILATDGVRRKGAELSDLREGRRRRAQGRGNVCASRNLGSRSGPSFWFWVESVRIFFDGPASECGRGRRVLDQYADRWALITALRRESVRSLHGDWRRSACTW